MLFTTSVIINCISNKGLACLSRYLIQDPIYLLSTFEQKQYFEITIYFCSQSSHNGPAGNYRPLKTIMDVLGVPIEASILIADLLERNRAAIISLHALLISAFGTNEPNIIGSR